ncbi:MAG: FAD-dependent oxidoreductase [Deltaproteobacteria bacterium]|nr:FAD-dependent oxidoreductase [Deltaproteobacteria bacterium]
MKEADVAIIGGGPAGLSAAIKAKESGLDKVVIIERGENLGGLLDQCIHNGFGLSYFGEDLTGPEYAWRLISKAEESGVESLLRCMVLKLYPDRRILLSSDMGLVELSARAVVLAMGCRERTREALNISGTRPAGILTAGTAQRYVNVYGYVPGKEAVILGSGDVGMIMARRLTLEGVKVKAVVEALPYTGGLIRNEVQCLHDFDIPLLLRHTVGEIHGDERLKAVTIVKVDEEFNPIAGTEELINCDTLLISAGLIPENELSRMAGIEIDPVTGGAIVDGLMQTSIPGIFAGGNVLHVNDLVDNVTLEAEIAGAGAATFVHEGEKTHGSRVKLKAGENIRYVVPQKVTIGEAVTISTRALKPMERVYVRVGNMMKKYFRVLKPSQLVRLDVSSAEWKKLDAGPDQITISCESKG